MSVLPIAAVLRLLPRVPVRMAVAALGHLSAADWRRLFARGALGVESLPALRGAAVRRLLATNRACDALEAVVVLLHAVDRCRPRLAPTELDRLQRSLAAGDGPARRACLEVVPHLVADELGVAGLVFARDAAALRLLADRPDADAAVFLTWLGTLGPSHHVLARTLVTCEAALHSSAVRDRLAAWARQSYDADRFATDAALVRHRLAAACASDVPAGAIVHADLALRRAATREAVEDLVVFTAFWGQAMPPETAALLREVPLPAQLPSAFASLVCHPTPSVRLAALARLPDDPQALI